MKPNPKTSFWLFLRWRYLEPPEEGWLHPIVDTATLLTLVVLGNVFLKPLDPGLVGLNPSPYLLVPVLIGFRYGFLAGLAGGGTILFLISLVRMVVTGEAPGILVTGRPYYSLAFPLAGVVCGELNGYFVRALKRRELLGDSNRKRMDMLDQENYLLRQAKDEVERNLAIANAELSSLDLEIRRLYQCHESALFGDLLDLIRRRFRVRCAAIYRVENNTTFIREAFCGPEKVFPVTLEKSRSGLIERVLEIQNLVTLPQFWKRDFLEQPDFLLGAPIPDASGKVKAVLVVHAMPFKYLNARSVHSIRLICLWAGRVMDARSHGEVDFRFAGGSTSKRIYALDNLVRSLALAEETFHKLEIPSSVLLIYNPTLAPDQQAAFESRVMTAIRMTDMPVVLDSTTPHLAIFMPLTGQRGARLALDRVMDFSRQQNDSLSRDLTGQLFHLEGGMTPDELMRQLRLALQKS